MRPILSEIFGAFIRWLWFLGRQPFSDLMADKYTMHNRLAVLALVTIWVIIYFFFLPFF